MSLTHYCIGNLSIIVSDAPYIYIWCTVSKITTGVADSTNEIIEMIVIIISLIIVVFVSYYIWKKAEEETEKIMQQRRTSAIARKTRSRVGTHTVQKSHYTSHKFDSVTDEKLASSTAKRMTFDGKEMML